MKKKIIDFYNKFLNGAIARKSSTLIKHGGTLIKHGGTLIKHSGSLIKHSGSLIKHSGSLIKQKSGILAKQSNATIKQGATKAFSAFKKSSGFMILRIKSGSSKTASWMRALGRSIVAKLQGLSTITTAFFKGSFGIPTLIILAILIISPFVYFFSTTKLRKHTEPTTLTAQQNQNPQQEFMILEQKITSTLAKLEQTVTLTEKRIQQGVNQQITRIEKQLEKQQAALKHIQSANANLEKTVKKTKFVPPTKATVNERIRREVSSQLNALDQQKALAEEKEDLTRKKKHLKKLLKEVLD